MQSNKCVICGKEVRRDKPHYLDYDTKKPIHSSCANREAAWHGAIITPIKAYTKRRKKNIVPLVVAGAAAAAPVIKKHGPKVAKAIGGWAKKAFKKGKKNPDYYNAVRRYARTLKQKPLSQVTIALMDKHGLTQFMAEKIAKEVKGIKNPQANISPAVKKILEERKKHPRYEVIVGNIGCVYTGHSKEEATQTYYDYVVASNSPYGRASGEDVSLFEDSELIDSHTGASIKIKSNPPATYNHQMVQDWFRRRYQGTNFDTLAYFNSWLANFDQYGEDAAVGLMDDKGRQIWSAIKRARLDDAGLLSQGPMQNPKGKWITIIPEHQFFAGADKVGKEMRVRSHGVLADDPNRMAVYVPATESFEYIPVSWIVDFLPVSNPGKDYAQRVAAAERKKGYRARVMPLGKDSYGCFVDGKREIRIRMAKPKAAKRAKGKAKTITVEVIPGVPETKVEIPKIEAPAMPEIGDVDIGKSILEAIEKAIPAQANPNNPTKTEAKEIADAERSKGNRARVMRLGKGNKWAAFVDGKREVRIRAPKVKAKAKGKAKAVKPEIPPEPAPAPTPKPAPAPVTEPETALESTPEPAPKAPPAPPAPVITPLKDLIAPAPAAAGDDAIAQAIIAAVQQAVPANNH